MDAQIATQFLIAVVGAVVGAATTYMFGLAPKTWEWWCRSLEQRMAKRLSRLLRRFDIKHGEDLTRDDTQNRSTLRKRLLPYLLDASDIQNGVVAWTRGDLFDRRGLAVEIRNMTGVDLHITVEGDPTLRLVKFPKAAGAGGVEPFAGRVSQIRFDLKSGAVKVVSISSESALGRLDNLCKHGSALAGVRTEFENLRVRASSEACEAVFQLNIPKCDGPLRVSG